MATKGDLESSDHSQNIAKSNAEINDVTVGFQFSSRVNDVLRVFACLYPRGIRKELIQPIFSYSIQAELDFAVESKILVAEQSIDCEEGEEEQKGKNGSSDIDGAPNDKDKTRATETRSYIYSFPNESVWKSVYFRLLPVDEREKSHLELARRLWKTLNLNTTESSSRLGNDENQQSVIDMILSQFIKGQKYITRDKEIAAVRSLCLHAGKVAAKKSSDFARAATYLNFGISLLDDDKGWKRQDEYAMTLALYNAAAEMECCIGNFAQMNKLIDKVLESAVCFIDKRQAYATRILGLAASKRQVEALETGFSVLHNLGECFPPKKRFQELHFMYEFWKTTRQLGRMSDGQILRLPPMQDENILHIMQTFNVLIFPAHMYNLLMGPLLSLRMMRLTLDCGLSAFAPVVFAHFGMICTVLGKLELGNRCGSLALELLDRYRAQEYLPRVYVGVYGVIRRYSKPPRDNIGPLREAYRVGMITGDLEFAGVAMAMACVHSFEAGNSLDTLHAEYCASRDAMYSKRQESHAQLTRPFIQGVEHLMGLSNDLPSPALEVVLNLDRSRLHLQQGRGVSMVSCIVSLWKMRIFYIFNDYESAAVLADRRRIFYDAFQIDPAFGFFCTMVAIAMLRHQGKSNCCWNKRHLRNAHFGLKRLRQLAKASPYDSSGKLCLVQAELASVRGDHGQAMLHYVMAMALTKQVENTFEYALANERTARHIIGTGDAAGAARYFQTALEAYKTWGGQAKVDRLASELETLYTDHNNGPTSNELMVTALPPAAASAAL